MSSLTHMYMKAQLTLRQSTVFSLMRLWVHPLLSWPTSSCWLVHAAWHHLSLLQINPSKWRLNRKKQNKGSGLVLCNMSSWNFSHSTALACLQMQKNSFVALQLSKCVHYSLLTSTMTSENTERWGRMDDELEMLKLHWQRIPVWLFVLGSQLALFCLLFYTQSKYNQATLNTTWCN